MREKRTAYVNGKPVPVLISDEKEALLAAHAAGGAIVGLWRPGMELDALSPAKYCIQDPEAVTDEFLERVARRRLGLPWRICETERLLIREMAGDDFDEIWENQVTGDFGTVEEFLAYTKHQYEFFEFGFWALVEKSSGELVGVAGLTTPAEQDEKNAFRIFVRDTGNGMGITLELGYHIFPPYRRKGYARESCLAIMQYGEEQLEAGQFIARIRKGNRASERLAEELGFSVSFFREKGLSKEAAIPYTDYCIQETKEIQEG